LVEPAATACDRDHEMSTSFGALGPDVLGRQLLLNRLEQALV
jgi:hypothetical protein